MGDQFVERWIDAAGEKAEVCFRNTSTERSIAFTSEGPLAVERALVWAFDHGCGVLEVRREEIT